MKLRTRTICFAFLLGLAFAMAGCSGKKEKPKEIRDINDVRAELRAQVDQGKLTREEAIVQLAEAQAKFGARERKRKRKCAIAGAMNHIGNSCAVRICTYSFLALDL